VPETLRSSPAPEGRCWAVIDRKITPGVAKVAILAGPGGPVLVPCSCLLIDW